MPSPHIKGLLKIKGECHVDVKKAQEKRDFTLLSLTEQTQTSQSWIATLAIRVRSFSDLTAQDDLPIIGKNEWQRLEGAWEESKRLEPSTAAIKGPHSHTHEHLLFL
ncbi:hypothetical protein Tco_1231016 [Tanacetum coccineum]